MAHDEYGALEAFLLEFPQSTHFFLTGKRVDMRGGKRE